MCMVHHVSIDSAIKVIILDESSCSIRVLGLQAPRHIKIFCKSMLILSCSQRLNMDEMINWESIYLEGCRWIRSLWRIKSIQDCFTFSFSKEILSESCLVWSSIQGPINSETLDKWRHNNIEKGHLFWKKLLPFWTQVKMGFVCFSWSKLKRTLV